MSIVEAIYENGVFRPIQKIDLEEGERVEIIVRTEVEVDPAVTIPDLAIDLGISDFAENIKLRCYESIRHNRGSHR